MKARELTHRSVVVVGASSGIGRATALAFADHGCRIVLVARSGDALEAVTAECRARGATDTLVQAADVADPFAVERVADSAVDAYGGIDVWVHAAASLIAARFGDEPLDEIRHLVDVDILGYVHGDRSALAVFRRQGHGTLVNVSSLLSIVPNPMVPLYVMSKFAITGLTRALVEATRDEDQIHVCLVLPGPVDTPLFAHAANHTGRQLRAIPPASAPERVAAVILRCARRPPRREVTVGATDSALLTARRLAPATTDRFVATWTARLLMRPVAAPTSAGTLFDALPAGRVHGGWRILGARRALGERYGRVLSRRGAPAVERRRDEGAIAGRHRRAPTRTAEGPE